MIAVPDRGGILARGDNRDLLEALLPAAAGQVRLLLLDPPYNARNRKAYPDDLDHETWLAGLVELVRRALPLLSPEGILAVHIDDSEQAWLQVALDRLLGRESRLNTVCVKMSELSGVKMRYQDRLLPRVKEYLLLYGAGPAARLRPLSRPKPPERLSRYLRYYRSVLENPGDPVEAWRVVPLARVLERENLPPDQAAAYQLRHADRCVYRTNNRWFDSLPPERRPGAPFARLVSPWGERYVWWEGKQMLFLSDHLEEPLSDLWTDVSTINLGREGGVALRSGKKPEALTRRILELCTAPGDLVLDLFSGSGTTAAVAHAAGRRWIAVERDPALWEASAGRLARLEAELGPGAPGFVLQPLPA